MLNKADTDFEAERKWQEALLFANAEARAAAASDHVACRELTVGELIQGRIERAGRTITELQQLRDALPANFLSRSASGLRAILGS